MAVKELKEFLFETYYRPTEFTKESSYYSMQHQKKKDLLLLAHKLIKKAGNAKGYYKSFLKNKNKKFVK